MSERIADVIKSRSDELVRLIFELTPSVPGSAPEDTRQFVVGFVHMLEQAARGNLEPRTQYLSGVVPAIRAGGMPGTVVLSGMAAVSMAVAAFFASDREALNWVVKFCCDYTSDLVIAYEI